ncbi:hypothetical protein L873DRAFT_1837569 [Choiromyces venosus 120613-1]|uniref:Holocytochrome c-type synthase n=1 Tax=Choiromyces venosus 120613-1 TaxID=1336337 RepID=A0A3N4JBC1_9PEZI|nr:hypothetical protein L873DRAFT_1837569 [Choiromyces venosus 120613-1]
MPSSENLNPAAAATGADAFPVTHSARSKWLSSAKPSTSCESLKMEKALPAGHLKPSNLELCVDREVSTIPRANMEALNWEHDPRHQDSRSGNWIYPSGEIFFNSMKRNDWDPRAEDMRAIVPIHNAEIKQWEAGRGSQKCGGLKLASQFMVLLGYQAPFDRHDWAVDRCGKKIDYVIDFYSGKPHPKWAEALSFYLDTCTPVRSYRQRETLLCQ